MEYMSVIESAIILPSRKNDFGGGKNGKVLFGVYDKARDVFLNHQRENKVWEDLSGRYEVLKKGRNNKVVSGSWLYAGPLFLHFGHFLSESITRLWAFDDLKSDINGVIFTVPPHVGEDFKPPKYMTDCFKFLGIDETKIRYENKLITVEMLYVPQQGSILNLGAEPWYDNKIAMWNSNFKKKSGGGGTFFSRKNFVSNGRVMGMGFFEKCLSKRCNVISPEEISFLEQLDIVHNSDVLIFEEGSSIHLLELFPKTNKKIFLIKRREGASYIESFLESKTTDFSVYGDITESPIIFDSDRRHNVCSRLNNPEGLFISLKDFGVLERDMVFEKNNFLQCENEDIKLYLKDKISTTYDYFN